MGTSEKQDQITILTSKGPLLTKTWEKDGTITGHGRAKQHTVRTVPVADIREAAQVFTKLRSLPASCVIRGEWIGREAEALIPDPDGEREVGFTLRQMSYFNDPAHSLILFDVDGYVPLLADPVTEPEEAIKEWIRFNLPPEFSGVTCYWHLSSSAGHPSKSGTLRAHLVFWLSRAMTSPEAAAYVTLMKIPVDRAPLHVVQANYLADPVMAPGVVDPVSLRAGLLEGPRGDVVVLTLDEGALAVAVLEMRRGTQTSGGGDGGVCLDPRLKKGVIGAFCRAFTPEDVLAAEWFPSAFERVNDRRWTWLDGGGSLEGAYITDDRQRLVNTHNTAPHNTIGQGLNAYDLTRVYKFGALDDAVPEGDRWTWSADPAARPSEGAMRAFAMTLPEVKADLDAARAVDNPFTLAQAEQAQEAAERTVATAIEFDADLLDILGPPPVLPLVVQATEVDFIDMPHEMSLDEKHGLEMGEKVKHRLFAMGVEDDERAALIDRHALRSAWMGCFYSPGNTKLYLMNMAGRVVQFVAADWESQVRMSFGSFLVEDVLGTVSTRLAEVNGTTPSDEAKAIRKAVWEVFTQHVKNNRQRAEVSFVVDMFAEKAGMVMEQDRVAITYTHEDLKTQKSGLSAEVEEAIVAEYREHFDLFDEFLDMMLCSRFAADRRQAFLHMKCMAGFGKGFLLQGVLGADGLGLVAEMSVTDVERCFEGAPSGLQPSDFVRAWILGVDEFKSAKGELKQLNNRIMMAPKGQLRAVVPVFFKVFLSAEGVDSLAGSEGVEAQFADRFAMYESSAGVRLDDRPLFKQYGKLAYRIVIANHAARVLNAGVARMRAVGPLVASKEADEGVASFHKAHAIGNTHELLSDTLPRIAEEIVDLVNDWALHTEKKGTSRLIEMLPTALKVKLEKSVKVVMGRRLRSDAPTKLVIASGLAGVIKDYLAITRDKSQQVMVGFKASEIASLVMGRPHNTPARYHDEDGTTSLTKGAILDLKMTAEMMAAAAEFGGADVLAFPEMGVV